MLVPFTVCANGTTGKKPAIKLSVYSSVSTPNNCWAFPGFPKR